MTEQKTHCFTCDKQGGEDFLTLLDSATSLLMKETNPEYVHRVIALLSNEKRRDKANFDKISRLSRAGGNIGGFFRIMHLCQIYSPPVINEVLNMESRNHSSFYIAMRKAEHRLVDGTSDIKAYHRLNKLRLVLERLYEKEHLPFKDSNGTGIPIHTEACYIAEPAEKIMEMIKVEFADA